MFSLLMLLSCLFFCLTHAKVLFAVGDQYSESQLYAKLPYFVLDFLSVQMIMLYLFPSYLSFNYNLANLIGGLHAVLHISYIYGWRRKSAHVKQIVSWCCERNFPHKLAKCGIPGFIWCFVGTAFDVGVHGWLGYKSYERMHII